MLDDCERQQSCRACLQENSFCQWSLETSRCEMGMGQADISDVRELEWCPQTGKWSLALIHLGQK